MAGIILKKENYEVIANCFPRTSELEELIDMED